MNDDDQPEDEYGEILEIEGQDEPDVEDTEDGGAIVRLDDEEEQRTSDFLDNLADELPDVELNRLSTQRADLQ